MLTATDKNRKYHKNEILLSITLTFRRWFLLLLICRRLHYVHTAIFLHLLPLPLRSVHFSRLTPDYARSPQDEPLRLM